MKTKIALLVVAAVLATFFYMRTRGDVPEGTLDRQVAAVLTRNDCLACHRFDAQKPWYAALPFADTLIVKDMRNAARAIDLEPVVAALDAGKPVSQVARAKLYYAVSRGTMPPLAYALAHWSSHLNAAETDVVLDWVRVQRAELARRAGSAPQFAQEPVFPLMPAPAVDARKVALGKALYNDKRLSKDDSLSCASCHNLQTGGVDRERYSKGYQGQRGGVNAPTVFNAVFQHRQFWDGRAADLSEQAGGPPLNPVEMASASWEEICAKLDKDAAFKKEFAAVYPDGFNGKNICDAIAEFEKTLVTPNARFDKYLKGDTAALTADEIEGYRLFKEAKCATCHAGHNLGGLTFEYMGVLDDYFAKRGNLTPADNGLYNFEKLNKNVGKFKTPTLRNVALTPPYFHDGTVPTLEAAVAHMRAYQSGVRLTDADIAHIVKFLKTLTGELDGKPLAED